MVEFINLKVFQIQLLIYFIGGKCFTPPQLLSPQLLCSQFTASPKAAAWLLLSGDQAALLRRQTSGAAHSRAGRTWRAL